MPFAQAQGASLYYEETGEGVPIVFVHEYATDCRSWEAQVRFFSRHYRCITFNARGYPPSEVPTDAALYGQDFARDDIAAVMDALQVDRAYVVGVSMGGAAALHFGMQYPERTLGIVATGAGSGAHAPDRARFQQESREGAQRLRDKGMEALIDGLAMGATRVQLFNKDRRGWQEYRDQLAQHDAEGAAMTLENYQGKRDSLFDYEEKLRAMQVPTLLVVGDEDDPVLETNLFLKRSIPRCGLWVLPRTGHGVNLEEPGPFNAGVLDFFGAVERGRWPARDPRARKGAPMLLPAGERA
jgi:pimeloyl-ACP methyl ester carboxylesterase